MAGFDEAEIGCLRVPGQPVPAGGSSAYRARARPSGVEATVYLGDKQIRRAGEMAGGGEIRGADTGAGAGDKGLGAAAADIIASGRRGVPDALRVELDDRGGVRGGADADVANVCGAVFEREADRGCVGDRGARRRRVPGEMGRGGEGGSCCEEGAGGGGGGDVDGWRRRRSPEEGSGFRGGGDA